MAQGPAAPTAPRTNTGAAAAAPTDGKVAVIDTSVFAERILEIKSKADVINKKYEPRFKELEAMKTQIATLEADIKQKQPIVTADKLQPMMDQYTQLQTTYKRRGEDLQNEYNREADGSIAPVRQKLQDFVKDYATKRGIILILDLPGSSQAGTIAYLNPAIDVTEDFIAEYNRLNPVPGAAAPARPAGSK
jgi:Skp family chaperone for outer membrane proteins